MTKYNVHVYREMRLFFPGIEANTPEEAATKARDLATADADDITSCDGETLAALVDVVGDDQFEHSITIDFESERLRKAAPVLLEALVSILPYAEAEAQYLDTVADSKNTELVAGQAWLLINEACAIIAKTKGGGQ
jgi:hypothetical protein